MTTGARASEGGSSKPPISSVAPVRASPATPRPAVRRPATVPQEVTIAATTMPPRTPQSGPLRSSSAWANSRRPGGVVARSKSIVLKVSSRCRGPASAETVPREGWSGKCAPHPARDGHVCLHVGNRLIRVEARPTFGARAAPLSGFGSVADPRRPLPRHLSLRHRPHGNMALVAASVGCAARAVSSAGERFVHTEGSLVRPSTAHPLVPSTWARG